MVKAGLEPAFGAGRRELVGLPARGHCGRRPRELGCRRDEWIAVEPVLAREVDGTVELEHRVAEDRHHAKQSASPEHHQIQEPWSGTPVDQNPPA